MGTGYFLSRGLYEVKKKYGLKNRSEKILNENKCSFSKEQWKTDRGKYWMRAPASIPVRQDAELVSRVTDIFANKFQFFNGIVLDLNPYKKWLQHPLTGYCYDTAVHWTQIQDLPDDRGDIKFIWERSRFCYLYDIMRYDHHYEKDSAEFVIAEIISWIEENPVDRGPNYVSSQEIALRVINWISVLHFYIDSPCLSEQRFSIICNSIYRQIKHVESELGFARKFVRNNHLLTEALVLFITGVIFPAFNEASSWQKKGYQVFTGEIQYQIADDGSYLQHTFNYQRIALQLMTVFFSMCRENGIAIKPENEKKARAAVRFYQTFVINDKGNMPAFGNNDGSLFFPLNDNGFYDNRPQVQALAALLGIKLYEENYKDMNWIAGCEENGQPLHQAQGSKSFEYEGYYTLTENNSFTFLWCPALNHRPSQADHLHLDIWYRNENILRDSGMFMYNTTDSPLRNYFFGSHSHNTVLYDDLDIMEKGERFIFYYWPVKLYAGIKEDTESFCITAGIKAFRQHGKYIVVNREVVKSKHAPHWTITDIIEHNSERKISQLWNITDSFKQWFNICAEDELGNTLEAEKKQAWYSPTYGVKMPSEQISYSTTSNMIITTISLKN